MSYTPIAANTLDAQWYDGLYESLFRDNTNFCRTRNFFDGVVQAQDIAIADVADDITGGWACDATETGTGNAALTKVTLTPVPLAVVKPNCINDLRLDAVFLRNWSRERPRDLAENTGFANYLVEFYRNAMVRDMLR